MVEYNINELCSIDAIFDFFNKFNYKIEDDRSAFPISELIEKPVEGDAWLIVNHTNLMIIVIRAEKFNQKSYRTKVNNYLKELAGMKLIFYTDEFNYYHLTLIYDGIFSIKFKPSDPDMIIVRIFEALESGEDLFDFTKQDINFILLKRELTAKALKESIKEGENSSVKIVFQDGGLKLIGKGSSKIIVAHEDAPIRDLVIDVNINSDIEQIEQEFIDIASDLYENYCSRKLKLICMITKKGIIYHWIPYSISDFINYKNPMDEDVMDDVLESLIAQVSYRTAFNSETFHQQFGTHSPFFILGTKSYRIFFEQELEKIKIMYEEWKTRFSKVYQSGDLDHELFIKHAYLALLVKTVLISKFVHINETNQIDNLQKIIEIFEERGVPIFLNDFFQWTSEEEIVQNEIFGAIQNADFIIDDLFRTIYQEMVSPETRHALGEFYTPPPLAEKMIEEVYDFGQYVLDPACGSGTFLVEILKAIESSHNSNEKKIEAISRIYGFDVNPIAVLVARSNLLLLTDKMFKNWKIIPINIFLADSLNPINEFTPILEDKKTEERIKFQSFDKWHDFGEVERFNMSALNDSLVINKKFFIYTDHFGNLLKELDKNLSKDVDFEKMIQLIYQSVDDSWLDEICEGNSKVLLRENFETIAKKLYNYVNQDQNHIWAYLLYNAIGVRKMKETMDGVDLIIGNPPWLTIADIMSYDYKESVKNMSKKLGIYMGGKQTPHAELCSVFFYKVRDLYLRKNGKIFFVTTATIETGDQHSKFRLFHHFKDIFLWKFKGDDIFRVHNICIGATNNDQPLLDRLKIKVKLFKSTRKGKNWQIDLEDESIYVPYNYDNVSRDMVSKRLVPLSIKEEMLPIEESHYKNSFYQGASLVPRCFFFINILSDSTIVPDKTLIQHEPWDFYPVDAFDIEEEYIYTICKSTELLPFAHLKDNKCFLPIEKEDHKYHPDRIKPKASELYQAFARKYNEIQQNNQRELINLWKNINHLNKLTNPKQFSQIKVIYNGSGSILKSAIIQGDKIIDSTLFYIGLEDLNEAIYICTILNAPCLTKQIKKTGTTGASGSIRHIQKRALDFPIPKFNQNNDLHLEIIKLGKELEKNIKELIQNLKNKEYLLLRNKYRCKHCGKEYSKKSFNRYSQKHQNECDRVKHEYNWTNNDWIDLEMISPDDIKLGRRSVYNSIFDNPDLKEKFETLDHLVIQLLNNEMGSG